MDHNFGVVIWGKIYRSAELNKSGLRHLKDFLDVSGSAFPKTIIYMNSEGYAFPLYFAINEYKAQKEYGFKFYHPFGELRTYLDGKDPYHPTDMIDKGTVLGPVGRHYFKMGDGKIAGGVDTLLKILAIIIDPANQPVLFHCLGGLHRTGMVAMLIRYMQDWPEGLILAEYHHYNRLFPRQENIDFVKSFSKDPRFLKLKEEFKKNL